MDNIEILGVMAETLDVFYLRFSHLETLCIAGIFMGIVALLIGIHILCGVKAVESRRAKGIAKYFENHYMGSFLDGKRFLKKRWYLLSRRSKREFYYFLNSTENIKDTEFLEAVLDKGEYGLKLVMRVYDVAMVIAGLFIFLKSYIYRLPELELIIYNTLSIMIMMAVRIGLYLMTRVVDRKYRKNSKRLAKSLSIIRYNNEYDVSLRKYVDDTSMFLKPSKEQVLANMEKQEAVLDGDSQVNLLDSMESSSGGLSKEDRIRYEEFVSRLSGEIS